MNIIDSNKISGRWLENIGSSMIGGIVVAFSISDNKVISFVNGEIVFYYSKLVLLIALLLIGLFFIMTGAKKQDSKRKQRK